MTVDASTQSPAPAAWIEHAVRAPSLLNSQPWRFVIDGASVQVYADPSRQLPHLDPDGREMVMSVGAAVLYLRIAARHHGWEPSVHPFPSATDANLVASVTFARADDSGDDRLFRALARRQTNRRPFTDEAVPPSVAADLARAVSAEGAALRIFDGQSDKDALAGLVSAGIVAQGKDRAVLDDIGRWLRPSNDPRPDGVRDSAQGPWDRNATMRSTAASVAAYKGRLIREAPAVLVLHTKADERRDWLAAGQALARALVVAADHGLAASYANEAIEVAALRPKMAERIGGAVPQAMFRVGYPVETSESARRYARDVTEQTAPSS